jgi:hypothetical protein
MVRQAIAELNVRQKSQTLAPSSMSFGIATSIDAWNGRIHSAASGRRALYQAKRDGRNRAVISLMAADDGARGALLPQGGPSTDRSRRFAVFLRSGTPQRRWDSAYESSYPGLKRQRSARG